MRVILLLIVLVFIAGLGALTGLDLADNGVTVIGILAILILVLFSFGIVGALLQPPRK